MRNENPSKEYFFEDFTVENYRKLLKIARKNFQFSDFTNQEPLQNDIIWRHDVDLSMSQACVLAKVEQEEGISSTYFILARGEFYNLLSEAGAKMVNTLLECGHKIGLHFYSSIYKIENVAQLEEWLLFEKQFLEKAFKIKIESFSFHNPFQFELTCEEKEYAGMINVYSSHYKKKYKYCSDSNGYWRYQRLEDVLHAGEGPLQILTHPGWWQNEPASPRQRVANCLNMQSQEIMDDYDAVLAKNNRENIGKK